MSVTAGKDASETFGGDSDKLESNFIKRSSLNAEYPTMAQAPESGVVIRFW